MSDEPLDLDELAAGGGGDDEQPAKPKRRRTERDRERDRNRRRSGQRRPSQEARLRETIEAAGGLLRQRGDEELGAVLERDAGKMARVCGSLALANPAAMRAITVLADVLEPIRAFGPTLRILWRRLLERRAAAQEAELGGGADEGPHIYEVEPDVAPPAAGAGEGDEPQVAEPWRIPGG